MAVCHYVAAAVVEVALNDWMYAYVDLDEWNDCYASSSAAHVRLRPREGAAGRDSSYPSLFYHCCHGC